jgi:hypothetical protein
MRESNAWGLCGMLLGMGSIKAMLIKSTTHGCHAL